MVEQKFGRIIFNSRCVR